MIDSKAHDENSEENTRLARLLFEIVWYLMWWRGRMIIANPIHKEHFKHVSRVFLQTTQFAFMATCIQEAVT